MKKDTSYDEMKIEIKELRQKLIDYFKKPNFDVTLSQLMRDFKLDLNDLDTLQYLVDELVKEKWITKVSSGFSYYEYDLGEKLKFGGLQ